MVVILLKITKNMRKVLWTFGYLNKNNYLCTRKPFNITRSV